ncbi:MAG: peptidoglycan DD-metalloendopeptidase family protein [Candidatus Omnitrophota bacterium]|nr:MAG: peptidoglycan DD-metalloendopeptidase family protein [Candidatus Omnitrophota bacterium]
MKKLFLFLAILVLTSCASRTSSRTDPHSYYSSRYTRRSRYSYKKGTIPYIIKKGDTLWEIAKEHGVSTKEIMRVNKVSSPERLKVGQKIYIPVQYKIPAGLSFFWPLQGNILNFFGENVNNVTNKGINIRTKSNASVKASEEGRVVFANYLKGWGDTLMLKHAHNYYTIYANLSQVSVAEGAEVKRGEAIGKVSSNNALHFEIRKNHLPQDPLKLLK